MAINVEIILNFLAKSEPRYSYRVYSYNKINMYSAVPREWFENMVLLEDDIPGLGIWSRLVQSKNACD